MVGGPSFLSRAPRTALAALSSSSLRFMVSMRRRMARLSYSSCCSPGPLARTVPPPRRLNSGFLPLTLGSLYSRSASSTSRRLAASLACASKMRMINSVLSTTVAPAAFSSTRACEAVNSSSATTKEASGRRPTPGAPPACHGPDTPCRPSGSAQEPQRPPCPASSQGVPILPSGGSPPPPPAPRDPHSYSCPYSTMHSIQLIWVREDSDGHAAFEGAHELIEPADLASGELPGASIYEGFCIFGGDLS